MIRNYGLHLASQTPRTLGRRPLLWFSITLTAFAALSGLALASHPACRSDGGCALSPRPSQGASVLVEDLADGGYQPPYNLVTNECGYGSGGPLEGDSGLEVCPAGASLMLYVSMNPQCLPSGPTVTYTIDYDDGTSGAAEDGSAGGNAGPYNHTYSQAGTYTITISWSSVDCPGDPGISEPPYTTPAGSVQAQPFIVGSSGGGSGGGPLSTNNIATSGVGTVVGGLAIGVGVVAILWSIPGVLLQPPVYRGVQINPPPIMNSAPASPPSTGPPLLGPSGGATPLGGQGDTFGNPPPAGYPAPTGPDQLGPLCQDGQQSISRPYRSGSWVGYWWWCPAGHWWLPSGIQTSGT